jgi:predicted flavoprotein YhiN
MQKSKKQVARRDPIPENFNSLEEFWAFWDTHSTADYEDFMEDVDIQINHGTTSRIYCAVAKDLVTQLRKQARQQGVSSQTLINLWLREKMLEAEHSREMV